MLPLLIVATELSCVLDLKVDRRSSEDEVFVELLKMILYYYNTSIHREQLFLSSIRNEKYHKPTIHYLLFHQNLYDN